MGMALFLSCAPLAFHAQIAADGGSLVPGQGETASPVEPGHTIASLTEEHMEGNASVRYIGPAETAQPPATDLLMVPPEPTGKGKTCMSANKEFADDDWCRSVCKSNATGEVDEAMRKQTTLAADASHKWPEKWCDPDYCTCIDASLSHDDLVRRVKAEERKHPSGLPDCQWPPGSDCTKDTMYECIEGPNAGKCTDRNWFERPSECKSSCVHTTLLWLAPHDKEWLPGPALDSKKEDKTVPRYQHDPQKTTMEKRGLGIRSLHTLMSPACGSGTKFVAVSMHSPKYTGKAERLLQSCARVGVCCKASQLPSNVFGDDAPEGSDAFRFKMISMKPAFILSQLQELKKPVVFMDTDLEFHKYPKLFDPGSWPDGGRDVAIFNYWGNETNGQVVPSLGSGVVYFNDTTRGTHVARAWAEAMAYKDNLRAPDDQVLNTLLSQGGWMNRASWGWLPTSYLRMMPAFCAPLRARTIWPRY